VFTRGVEGVARKPRKTGGYLMAPLLSKELYEFIFENLPLSQEVNISRFNKL
jgi:hypothetical protein